MRNKVYNTLKRIFDIIAASCAILVFAIPWIAIAVTIKIQSPGPTFYKAKRVGLNGKVFTLYKFRSMRVDSGNVHATTLRNDPRIFPFGEFLRKSKLDETPQLINIFFGDMSVIGPRPEDLDNSDKFYVGEYRNILSVKPGLSSPASLYDYTFGEVFESEEEYVKSFMPEKLDLELYYVAHKSFWYDMKIIVQTVWTILLCTVGYKNFKKPHELELLNKNDTYVKRKDLV